MLFPDLSALPSDAPIFMAEDMGLATRSRVHQQKLVLFFSAMRHYAAGLEREVTYRSLDDAALLDSLAAFMRARGDRELHTFEPHDRFMARALSVWARDAGFGLVLYPSPGFVTDADDWERYARGRRRRLMGEFYVWQRKRLAVLVGAEGEPEGGRWSFDEENRRPVPRGLVPPRIAWREPDEVTREVIATVETRFADHPGRARDFRWPVTRSEALEWLDDFLRARFGLFGPYEDAMVAEEDALWHSLLSPLLNLGLLTPREVLDRALETPGVPIASREGFVRQLIGWREFVRGIDREYAENGRDEANALGHMRELRECWRTASTGLPPLDAALARVLRLGWCHHIERLMVIGAAMLMAEVRPRAAFDWFMEMFVDSAEWVMGPNVYGMSQFSDGGTFATKPYLSGSAYLRRMSDHAPGPWCDVWDGLYWRFVERHEALFAGNPRLSAVARGAARLDPSRKERIFSAAEAWIESVTRA